MKLLLAGATGLVGGHVLAQALADPRIDAVIAPVRRALPAHAAGGQCSLGGAESLPGVPRRNRAL